MFLAGDGPPVSVDNFAKTAGLSAIFLRKNKEQPVSGAAPFAVTYSIILSSSPLSIVDGISFRKISMWSL